MIIILSHYFWSLNKWEAHMQTVVIPTPFTWFGCKYPQIKADSLQLKHIFFRFIWNPLWWCIEPKMLELCRCPNIYGPDCMWIKVYIKSVQCIFLVSKWSILVIGYHQLACSRNQLDNLKLVWPASNCFVAVKGALSDFFIFF